MALDPKSRDTVLVAAAAAIALTLFTAIAAPDVANGALKSAAGGGEG